ncbi:MAG: DinB family protein [Dehalococcoidia bacterium]
MEPFVDAALTVAKMGHQALREAVQRADGSALNWQPAPETNSIYMLVHHALNSEKRWLVRAIGEEFGHEREADFRLRGDDPVDLLRRIDEADADVGHYLSQLRPEDLTRQIPYREQQVSGAWAVVHALEHVREHVGHIGLTLQIWGQQQRPAS